MSLSSDVLTRARGVLGGLMRTMNTGGYGDYIGDLDDAGPALIRLASAVARLSNRNYGHHPWWAYENGDGRYVYCFGCRGGGKTADDVDHAAGCCALAIDAAFADIAALASDV